MSRKSLIAAGAVVGAIIVAEVWAYAIPSTAVVINSLVLLPLILAGVLLLRTKSGSLPQWYRAALSPAMCLLVGMNYHWFNLHYVIHWWVHCRRCASIRPIPEPGSPPLPPAPVIGFDANDFTMIFFGCLFLLATIPVVLTFRRRRWLWTSLAVIGDALICFVFMSLNLWA